MGKVVCSIAVRIPVRGKKTVFSCSLASRSTKFPRLAKGRFLKLDGRQKKFVGGGPLLFFPSSSGKGIYVVGSFFLRNNKVFLPSVAPYLAVRGALRNWTEKGTRTPSTPGSRSSEHSSGGLVGRERERESFEREERRLKRKKERERKK